MVAQFNIPFPLLSSGEVAPSPSHYSDPTYLNLVLDDAYIYGHMQSCQGDIFPFTLILKFGAKPTETAKPAPPSSERREMIGSCPKRAHS